MSRYNLTTYNGALPPEGADFHTRKAPGLLAARLNGRNTSKPDAWSVLVPPQQTRPHTTWMTSSGSVRG